MGRSLQGGQDTDLPGESWWNQCLKMCSWEEKGQSLPPSLTQSGPRIVETQGLQQGGGEVE